MKNFKLLICLLLLSGFSKAQINIQPFAVEVFNKISNVRDLTISKNGNELYFTAQSVKQEFSAIMFSTKSKNNWSDPQVASFSGQYKDLEAFLSQDGLTLFFASNRPVKGRETEKTNYDLWKVERLTLTSEWATPSNLGEPINTEGDEFYPSVASNGNLYFTAVRDDGLGKEDILISKYNNDKYSTPSFLPEAINSKGYEFNAFIAPDESHLLFTGYKRIDGLGRGDLYISKKNESGKWQPSVHLKVNSTGIDYCPFVIDGILYFTSDRSQLKSKYENPLSTQEFLNEINKIENGQSRIYRTATSNWLVN